MPATLWLKCPPKEKLLASSSVEVEPNIFKERYVLGDTCYYTSSTTYGVVGINRIATFSGMDR